MICPRCHEKMYCYGGDDKIMVYTHTKKQKCDNVIEKPRLRKYRKRQTKW